MKISNEVWETLEKLERGRFGKAEDVLREWIVLAEDADGQMVIALIHKVIARAADEKDAVMVRGRPEYAAVADLISHSPLQQIMSYDPESKEIKVLDGISACEANELVEFMAKFGVSID